DNLPSSEHVDRLTRQLTIIEMLCKELYAANILELKAVTRETFEEQPLPGQPGSEPQPASRRRRRRDEASAPAPVAAVRETARYFSKQRFTLEFLARPAAFITALNRLAAMKLFVVVAETEFRKTDDPLSKRSAKKKEDAAPGQGGGGEAAVDPATLTHVQRLVTDPDLEPPVNVKLDIDVYSFEGV
ncbi:MAG: Amuc_1100 family pilus-like protein, partial [Kiritimatiellae bacterium]|nr:Amuc_1100 family pilus-like protein [Kiritimatiellia bacterium]